MGFPPIEDGRRVDLPHDWSIEDIPGLGRPFDGTLSDGGPCCGHAVGGISWYQKRLTIEEEGLYEIILGGVMGLADIHIDGRHVMFHPYGYTPVILRERLSQGEHILGVRVRSIGSHSRWYSGSGLYRQASWRLLGPGARLAPMGLWARTLSVNKGSAQVLVSADGEEGGSGKLELFDPAGTPVASMDVELQEGPNSWELTVPEPELWLPWDLSPGRSVQPLYQVRLTLGSGIETAPLGIRLVEMDAVAGLRVNGVRTLLKGGCLHHDLGILGAAAYPGAEVRRVKLLKAAGFNAIRTSHNPPSVEFLEACDQEGIVVMDEAFDEWVSHKTPDSYARWFEEWSERDLKAMVRRDRSHPSVFFWSIGNEILDSYSRPDIAARLRAQVLEEDPSRQITAGICKPWWGRSEDWEWEKDSDVAFESLDFGGYNYLWQEAEKDGSRVPARVIQHTETFPMEAWEGWNQVVSQPRIVGDFVWTAMDYIGESAIGQTYVGPDGLENGRYPSHLAVCGDLDLIGDRKPQSYYREALWREGVLYAAASPSPEARGLRLSEAWLKSWGWSAVEPHWNWDGYEGQPIDVEVYSSFDRVEALLNGRVIGEAKTSWEDRRRAQFQVVYEPGVLEVRGFTGSQVKTFKLETSGPAELLSARVESIEGDLTFLCLEAVDGQNRRAYGCTAEVTLSASEEVRLLAFGSASPSDPSSVQDSSHQLYGGRALVILKGRRGAVEFHAPGLNSAKVEWERGE
jgi:beta-galactosidase